MSTQAERQIAAIKRTNDLLNGRIDPSLSTEEQRTRRAQILEARSAYADDDDQEQPDQPRSPKVCPLSRAKLRTVIKAGLEHGFDNSLVCNDFLRHSVAVGCAELDLDESDPVFVKGIVSYFHGDDTSMADAGVIMNAMHTVLVSDKMREAQEHICIDGGHAPIADPENKFRVSFVVRCPA